MRIVPGVRHGYSIFCDDIRQEVGGKLSYMGIYRHVLYPGGGLPLVLPTFAVVANFIEPAADPFEPITFKLFLPGQDDDDGQPSAQVDIEHAEGEPDPTRPIDKQVRSFVIPFRFTPLQIATTGQIRVRVERGDERYLIGALQIAAGPLDANGETSSSSADVDASAP